MHMVVEVNDFARDGVCSPSHHSRREVIIDHLSDTWLMVCAVGAEHGFHFFCAKGQGLVGLITITVDIPLTTARLIT